MGAPFARLPEVRQFQIVHDAGGLEIRLVLDPAAGPDVPEITVQPVDARARRPGPRPS